MTEPHNLLDDLDEVTIIKVKDVNKFTEICNEINRRLMLLEDMFIYEQRTINGKPHYLLAIPKERYLE